MRDVRSHFIADALIENGGRYLMVRRAEDREYYPDCWAGIGGRMEPGETQDPASACLREIFEETGLPPEEIYDLTLRYVILSKRGVKLVHHYVFTGRSGTDDITGSEEGIPEWVGRERIPGLKTTDYYGSFLEHYFTVGINDGSLYIGNAASDEGVIRFYAD
jgi:8-oxo-dGTP diphosphatase